MNFLKSQSGRTVFCMCVTLFGIAMATGMEFVFYPEEFATTAPGKKALIVSVIAMPVSWLVSGVMRSNLILNEELTKLVQRDRLTDVATRDFFFSRLEQNDRSYGASLMIDIDNFKSVNDTYGHFAGDVVIKMVARVLKSETRKDDIVCRFGGEEFVAFLHKATREEAWAIAERIRQSTKDAIASTDAGDIQVTVSVGGSLKSQIEEIDTSIRRADACLYKAKQTGRNKTVVDWPIDTDRVSGAVGLCSLLTGQAPAKAG